MSIDLNKIFGRVMKTWRIGRELSQVQAADLLKMSQAGYSKLEAGQVDTALSTVAKASEITGLSLGALLAEGPASSPEHIPLPLALQTVLDAGYGVTPRVLREEPIRPET